MKRRVVITGIGPVTSIGIGKKKFINSIFGLKTNILPIPAAYQKKYSFKSKFYVPAPDISLQEFGIPEKLNSIMVETSKVTAVAAKLALEDAAINVCENERYFQAEGFEEGCVVVGVGMGSLKPALHSYMAHISDTEKGAPDTGAYRYNRMAIPMLMTNSPAAWVSILFGIKGSCNTLNASCASGSFAIGEAYRRIKDGYSKMAIAGGAEVLSEETGSIMRGFDMLSTLTRSDDGYPTPFSKKRSGFLFNDGAGCMLVIEELRHAQKRGAEIYAEIEGYECNSDSYSITQIDPSGSQIHSLLHKLSNGIKIDYINAHGTGTTANDEIEGSVIQNIFGNKDSQPYINSTKGVLGHSIGASGAIEAAVTAISIKESKVHANLLDDPIENLNLPLETVEDRIDRALSVSYGFGGHNAAILLKRYIENE